jgi:cytosine deaminase
VSRRTVLVGLRRLDGSSGELHLDGGLVAEPASDPYATVLSAHGLVALPRLCDPHVHLDKTFAGGPWRRHVPASSLAQRVEQEATALADPRERPVLERARSLAALLLANGSTLVRSHVDVSSRIGLARVEALLELRAEVAEQMSIRLVAFPQQGILASPGTEELLAEALRLGVEAVGGLDPHDFDGDREAHLDVVFGLATRFDKDVDIHLHERGSHGLATLLSIAERTRANGLEGRVCVSHGFALATATDDEVTRAAEAMAAGGVALVTNLPGSGLLPPVDLLLEHGVRVAVGSDNIRDSWSPFGHGDQLARCALAAYLHDWRDDESLLGSLDLVTTAPAALLGEPTATLRVGDPADFVLLPASCASEALVAAPSGRSVYRNGSRVAGPALAEAGTG